MFSVFLDGLSVLGEKWMVVFGAVCLVCLGCSVSYLLFRDSAEDRRIFWPGNLLPLLFFVITVPLRLAFLTEAFVPAYFDSVEHYRIIKELVTVWERSTLPESITILTPDYYHLGFHFLASLLTLVLRADPMDVILVLGQVILAAIPIPVFYLLWHETKSVAAAFFGMLLAGFGWYMPGFAVNWGKYPALAGLLTQELVLSIAYGIARKNSNGNQNIYIGLLTMMILVSTLFHTRTLIVVALSIFSWLIAGKIQIPPIALQGTSGQKQPSARGAIPSIRILLHSHTVLRALRRKLLASTSSPQGNDLKYSQYVLPGIILAGLLVLGTVVKREPLLNLALEPYLGAGLWTTLTVLALSLFALIKFPQGAYFSLFFILFVFAALFIPVPPWFTGLENQTLLDRPFAEMLLYLPLSILGGVGLAGLLEMLKEKYTLPNKISAQIRGLVFILLLGFAGLLLSARYDLYPSDCCNLVKFDDTIALDWLGKNLPPEAQILIAAAPLNVLPTGPSPGLVGTDAGIWIPALTGRSVSLATFDSNFRSGSTLEELCQKQIEYIYVGGTIQIFDITQLSEKAEWYDRIFSLPNAKLYRLTGCSR